MPESSDSCERSFIVEVPTLQSKSGTQISGWSFSLWGRRNSRFFRKVMTQLGEGLSILFCLTMRFLVTYFRWIRTDRLRRWSPTKRRSQSGDSIASMIFVSNLRTVAHGHRTLRSQSAITRRKKSQTIGKSKLHGCFCTPAFARRDAQLHMVEFMTRPGNERRRGQPLSVNA